MSKKELRRLSRKALTHITDIITKYSSEISNIAKVNEDKRAWLQLKIQQIRECMKPLWQSFSKSSWWEPLRNTRNKTAHTKGDLEDDDFSQLCNDLFTHIHTIKQDLENHIKHYKQNKKKKRKFENSATPESLFGSFEERCQLVDAMEDTIAPVEPKDVVIAFPNNQFSHIAKDTLSEILNTENIQNYLFEHEGVSENVQTDILEWMQKTNNTLERENPFWEEEIFIAQQKKKSVEEIANDLAKETSKLQCHYELLPSINKSKRGNIQASSLNFDFYCKEFASQKKITKKKEDNDLATENKKNESIQWKNVEKLKALHRNFLNDMEITFIERKNKWMQEQIDNMRKPFLETLYQKIQNFIKLEKLLSPFINDFGRLWDMSSHPFETSGFEILETFANLLEQDKSLQELADMLGKQSRLQAKFEKEMRDKVIIKTEWHPEAAYRGEISGIKYSNDIASTLPRELAMLKNTHTKKLFQLKFAQKQLLAFEFQNKIENTKEVVEKEEVSVEKQEQKGPIIICVDTSGSMHGSPENIAKTVTFAFSKIALEQMRKCFIISFSTDIETLEIKANDDFEMTSVADENYLQKLVKFLRMSFNGGTDAEPALKKAVKMLNKDGAEGYKNADVLMISDFVMSELSDDLVNEITREKGKGSAFYSLVIGESGNQNTISSFDHNWMYNTNDTQAERHLMEQLHKMKARKYIKHNN